MKTTLTIDGAKTTIDCVTSSSTISKQVETEEVIKLFQSKTVQLETPFFPKGVIKYAKSNNKEHFLFIEDAKEVVLKYDDYALEDSISNIHHRAHSHFASLFHEHDAFSYAQDGTRYNEEYDEDEDRTVLPLKTIMPKTAWFVELSTTPHGKHMSDYKVYGLLDEIVFPESSVYLFPFPNIYDNHRICWGSPGPELSTPYHMHGLSPFFFNQVSNFDLVIHNTKSVHEYAEGDPLFLHMNMHLKAAGNEPFSDRLAYLEKHMLKLESRTLENAFDSFTRGQN